MGSVSSASAEAMRDAGGGARDVEVGAHVLCPDALHELPPVDREDLAEGVSQVGAGHFLLVQSLSVRLALLVREEAGLLGCGRRAQAGTMFIQFNSLPLQLRGGGMPRVCPEGRLEREE